MALHKYIACTINNEAEMIRNIMLVLMIVILIGCVPSPNPRVNQTPTPLIDQINIELANVDYSLNQYLISAYITNLSENRLWFPIGLNGIYSVYDQVERKWVPVKDTMKVVSLRPQIILEPHGDVIKDNYLLTISPEIPNEIINQKADMKFRIEISGYKMNGEEITAVPVTANLELIIKTP
jgi:hypothetical protein